MPSNKDGYMKEYYEQHKATLKARSLSDVRCECCDKTIKYAKMNMHKRSKNHKLNLQLLSENAKTTKE